MSEQFFSKSAQDDLKSRWGDPSSFDPDVAINFTSYYTRMDGSTHKSLSYKVGDFSFGSHLAWWYPKGKVSSLTVEVSRDPLTNEAVVEGTETGFTIQQPYGIELAHLSLNPGENGIFVDKSWFTTDSGSHKKLPLIYSKGKGYRSSRKYNSFTLSPLRGVAGGEGGKDRTGYPHRNIREASSIVGWEAVSAEVIDDHTLRVYLTDSLYRENVDLHNLVLQLKFSESLEACQVGFNDIPNYFGEIVARGVDGETILRERFGS